jgi:hypothetical protein
MLLLQLAPETALVMARSDQNMLAQLRSILKSAPHLIVIDNLETLEDVESLLPTLQDFADPTRFILTSRESLYGHPNIYHHPVCELSESYSLHLIRQEAKLSNLSVLAACADHELRPIWRTVGGNPLALRLVVGQTHVYPLEAILQDLEQAKGRAAGNLYTFIYRRAWDCLNRLEQDVLLIMPLANPQGDDIEFVAEVGEMELGDVRRGLERLVQLNLVDARGGVNNRRYSIHALTRTFLQEQVNKWRDQSFPPHPSSESDELSDNDKSHNSNES